MPKKEKKNSVPTMQDRLRELADDYGGNTGLAEQTGISRQSIGAYINGDRTPDCAILKQISERTGASTDWILGLYPMKHADASVRAVNVHTLISPESIEIYDKLKDQYYQELPHVIDILMQNPQFSDLIVSILKLYGFGFGGNVSAPMNLAQYTDVFSDVRLALQYRATKIFDSMMEDLFQHGEDEHDDFLKKVQDQLDDMKTDEDGHPTLNLPE